MRDDRDILRELIKSSKSSIWMRHSVVTEKELEKLLDEIMNRIVIPLSNEKRKDNFSVKGSSETNIVYDEDVKMGVSFDGYQYKFEFQ